MFTDSLERAIGLIEQSKPIEAQKMLKRLISTDHHNLPAWFWLLETCPTNEQRINVLEICLEHNPDSEQVKQALDRLRSTSTQSLPPIGYSNYTVSPSNSTQSSTYGIFKPSKSPFHKTLSVVETIVIIFLVTFCIFLCG